MTACATPVRISGAVPDATDTIRMSTLTKKLWSMKGPCCRRDADQPAKMPLDRCGCCYTRVSTTLVVVVRHSQGETFSSLTQRPRVTLATARHLPYLKLQVGACRSRRYPIFVDLGQAIVVPCDAALSIVGPELAAPGFTPRSFFREVPENTATPIPPPVAGNHNMIDAWIFAEAECTDYCDPSDAILTDSDVGANVIFPVPAGADQVEIIAGRAGQTFTALWAVGDGTLANLRTIGESALGSGAFGNHEPRCVCVNPSATHLLITSTLATVPIAVAWRVRP